MSKALEGDKLYFDDPTSISITTTPAMDDPLNILDTQKSDQSPHLNNYQAANRPKTPNSPNIELWSCSTNTTDSSDGLFNYYPPAQYSINYPPQLSQVFNHNDTNPQLLSSAMFKMTDIPIKSDYMITTSNAPQYVQNSPQSNQHNLNYHPDIQLTPSIEPGNDQTQIMVKNTFLQLDPAIEHDNIRPRGESCDAVLVSSYPATNTSFNKNLDSLNCIHENPNGELDSRYSKEDDSADASCSKDLGPLQPLEETSIDKQSVRVANLSPSELVKSLSSCDELKRIALEDLPTPPHEKTTVMLRNIPNKYTQAMLLKTVNQEFEGLYDFFYLPIDFKNKCNVGYAFINFIHPFYAELFSKKFTGMKLTAFKSKKICEISWGRVQGFRANIEHYKNSAIMSIPNSHYRPLIFKDGIPLQFPGQQQQQASHAQNAHGAALSTSQKASASDIKVVEAVSPNVQE